MYRSQLFAAAHENRALEEAFSSGADSIILDLEDTVAYEHKEAARQGTLEVLHEGGPSPLAVRVNGVASRFILDDLTTLVRGAGEYLREVWIPKVETADQVGHVDWLLGNLESAAGLAHGHIGLFVLVETARGLTELQAIARACPRTLQLGFGMADLASDLTLGWPSDGLEQLHIRTSVAIASRAVGLWRPIDSVWPRVDDLQGLAEDCRAAKSLGFCGKFAIDPAQIETINEAFSPTEAEVRHAEVLLASFARAERDGRAALRLPSGEFVDYAFLRRAEATLEMARRLSPEQQRSDAR